ncbi:DUF2617 family protein [Pilimelia columellifera]|uniref:DUF2617 family protein n=1 Tax=Pilimelia columellifera subsp. columellifera TaxID=706583 RepID=A0ABN3MVD8_9ACTN
MLVSVQTAYADTSADKLSFALDEPLADALHVLDLPTVGLQLRLLGASHQVALPDGRIETVACLPGRPSRLPERAEAPGYRFVARVRLLSAGELSVEVAQLRRTLVSDPNALLGEFPGHPDAITAIQVEPLAGGPLRWRTWHAYPQSGELVTTATEASR